MCANIKWFIAILFVNGYLRVYCQIATIALKKHYLQFVLNLIVNLDVMVTPVLPIFETRYMSDFDRQ